MREPHKAERDLCSALITYLTPLAAGTVGGDGQATATVSSDVDSLGKTFDASSTRYQA